MSGAPTGKGAPGDRVEYWRPRGGARFAPRGCAADASRASNGLV